MGRWIVAAHFVVIGLMWYFAALPDSALAASEAQLKFVPVPSAASPSAEKSRPPHDSSVSLAAKKRPANTTISTLSRELDAVPIQRQLIGSEEPDSGHLEAAATYHHQQLQRGRGGGHGPGSPYLGEYHSRNFRGSRGYKSQSNGIQGTTEHFGVPHGEHYPFSRYHKEQRFGKHYGGQSSRLQHIPLQESRVEVRIDDYRRDQRAINHAIRLQHGGQHHQQGSDQHQQHFDRDSGESWKNHPGQRSAGANDIIQNKNRPFEGSITGQVSDTDSEEGASCGPRSPCLEPNGLFPLNGNCCGFVSCANCRPYTQRCAAATVFDLDLWLCNHERDTQQCAGNNRDCAYAAVNLRGEYGDSTDGSQGGLGRPQNYPSSDGPSYHQGQLHNGPSYQNPSYQNPSHQGRHHLSHLSSDYGRSSQGHRGSGWEYASASEVRVSRKSGKVPRVMKEIIKDSKKKKAAAAS